MSKAKIRQALEKHLKTFADTKGIQVAWENKSNIPTVNYLKPVIFPSNTANPSVGPSHKRYMGIFRVTYYSTALNDGMASIESMVADLVAHFPRALALTKDNVVVHIENTPSEGTPGYEANYIYVSVEMVYRADVFT